MHRVEQPFTSREGHDPYQVMVEEFSVAALRGEPAPYPVDSSIDNMRLLDRIREAAG